MIRRVIFLYIKTMYINAHKKRLNWIYYTLFFGALPILIRLIVSLTSPDSQIPPIVVGDVVFWGIMFNAVALYNVSSAENIPDVQVSAAASAFIRTAFLVSIYTAALFPGINQSVMWIAATFFTILSLTSSYLTTDSAVMFAQQQMYDLANNVEGLPASVRVQVRKIVERSLEDGQKVDIKAEIEKCLAQYKQDIGAE